MRQVYIYFHRIAFLVSLVVFSLVRAESSKANEYLTQILQLAFGAQTPNIQSELIQRRFSESNGSRPADRIHSGDVIVYLGTSGAGVPAVYSKGLQGFSHATIVARDPNKVLYNLDNPSCGNDFRGSEPYVVVRPKRMATGSPERFQNSVDDLVNKMKQMTINYDPFFSTDIFGWSPDARARFRAELMRWRPGASVTPTMPDMYCSEVPVTVHALLGVSMHNTSTIGNILDLGFAEQLKSGVSREELATRSAHDLISSFQHNYEQRRKSYEGQLQNQLSANERNEVSAALRSTNLTIKRLQENEQNLADLFRHQLGIPLKSKGSSVSNTLQTLYTKLEFFLKISSSIVRPVDFVKEALSPNGNYEVVGYYDGNMRSVCSPTFRSQTQGNVEPLEDEESEGNGIFLSRPARALR